jgi:DNA polymerase I-like protein with 3'-5' exonuclease and polymerase domains
LSYLSNNYLVLDFETTNHERGTALNKDNSLVLACWRRGPGHPNVGRGLRDQVHWGSEFDQGRLLEEIQRADFIVGHNLKFEYQWLARCGLDLREVFGYDTLLGQYVLNGNVKTPLGLDAVARTYGLAGKGSVVSALIAAGVCPSEIPRSMLREYCEGDVSLTDEVFRRQRGILHSAGLLPVAYSRNLVTPVLADMESKGMCLDKDRVLETYKVRITEFNSTLEEFARVTGGINPRSAKQLREFIYGKLAFPDVTDYRGNAVVTGAGERSVSRDTIGRLQATTPEQKEFKRLALLIALDKIPVNNLKKMKAILDRGENIVYAKFNQAITQTHRLSSSGRNGGFQFHNFDRAFKRLFCSRKDGRAVVESDAPQLEFRGAAELGGDVEAFRSIFAGEDIHALTASTLGLTRQDAKKFTFGPLYGKNTGTKKELAYYKAFREKYPQIYRKQQAWCAEVLKTGKLKLPWGMTFYWPGTKMSRTGYIDNTTSIFNYPIQSFATAEIIPLTLVLIWHRIGNLGVDLVNTIHDSVIAEVDEKDVDKYKEIVVDSFTRDIYWLIEKLYGMKMTVPLGVDIKAGKHWGETG